MILFDSMRQELGRTNYMLSNMIKGKVSLDRFNAFFKETELLDSFEALETLTTRDVAQDGQQEIDSDEIMLRNASFTWNPAVDGTQTPSSAFTLRVPGELRFEKGKINLIVGATYVSSFVGIDVAAHLIHLLVVREKHPCSWHSLERCTLCRRSPIRNSTFLVQAAFRSQSRSRGCKMKRLGIIYSSTLRMTRSGIRRVSNVNCDVENGVLIWNAST